jgi:molybdopterin-dependent oxidoreductase alpha subunit
MTRRRIPGISDYRGPAGGWGALKAVGQALADQNTLLQGGETLLRANQPDGFDCPGCAWPDPKHTSSFEFCENGAKAVAWEATSRRAGPELFAQHTVKDLFSWSDHALEDAGRLTHPLRYDPATDKYVPVEWAQTFSMIGQAFSQLEHPDQAEFYASGRTSNEAAFLYQLLGRKVGTNNFPDCSNLCHEPTSVGLPDSIGLGKGSVSLEDFDHADLVLSFGHNPGTNHPRMMATLRDVSRRGASILVFNPLRERALERFASPQDPLEMATLSATPIASHYYQVTLGGDAALTEVMMKVLVEWDDQAVSECQEPVLDHDFIAQHTIDFAALKQHLLQLDWNDLEARSGVTRAQMAEAATIYARAKATILCYGMGLTQHRNASSTVQQLANLLLLKGNIGKPGAGICPLRGHSNVQGARTVGVWEKPSESFLDRLDQVFEFKAPRDPGHTVIEAIAAMETGQTRVFIGLGGNFAVAAPDPLRTFAALPKVGLTVHIATKLNRTHLLHGKDSLILPCLGRTEIDLQAGSRQAITVEDSMSMVHASRGLNPPASDLLKSEPDIVASMARAILGPDDPVNWEAMTLDYSLIRDLIEQTLPDSFEGYNQRVAIPGGFRLPVAPADRVWKTPSGRARFLVFAPQADQARKGEDGVLLLTTLRSHNQYNTTIYGLGDRYRGVTGRRDVVFANALDLGRLGLSDGDLVDLEAAFDPTGQRRLKGFTVVERDIPQGCLAAYYPETNILILLDDHDQRSGTPAYKSVPVRMMAHVRA